MVHVVKGSQYSAYTVYIDTAPALVRPSPSPSPLSHPACRCRMPFFATIAETQTPRQQPIAETQTLVTNRLQKPKPPLLASLAV
jgi:hypothetical protein